MIQFRENKLYRLDVAGYTDWYTQWTGQPPTYTAPCVRVRQAAPVYSPWAATDLIAVQFPDDPTRDGHHGVMVPVVFLGAYTT